MVTTEARRGRMIAELDYLTYKAVAGKIRSSLPPHVYVSPERITEERGKVVRLWSRYPEAAKRAVQKALGK